MTSANWDGSTLQNRGSSDRALAPRPTSARNSGLVVRTHFKPGYSPSGTPGFVLDIPSLPGDLLAHVRERLSAPQVLDRSRFWELDAMRGLAVSMMVAYHFLNGWGRALAPDLAGRALGAWTPVKNLLIAGVVGSLIYQALLLSPACASLPQGTRQAAALVLAALAGTLLANAGVGASSFLFVSGLALAVRSRRTPERAVLRTRLVRRAAVLSALGAGVTALSLWLLPARPIWFGILQLMAADSLISLPLLDRSPAVMAAAGLGSIAAGRLLGEAALPAVLLPLLPASAAPSFDYTPLLPWSGYALLGLAAGSVLYGEGSQRNFDLPDWEDHPLVRALAWIGRRALPIYLAQMPLALSGAAAAGLG